MKKRFIFFTVLIIIVIILIGIIGSKVFTKESDKETKYYKIDYFDDINPGSSYILKIDEALNVEVTHQPGCTTNDCLEGDNYPETKVYNVDINEENRQKLQIYFEEIFKNEKNNEMKITGSNDDKKANVIKSIINNDNNLLEIYLEEYEYRLIYSYGYKTVYFIFLNQNQIQVKQAEYDDTDKISRLRSYYIAFNEHNMATIINIIKEQFKDSYEVIINRPYGNILTILQSLINYNEEELQQLNTKNLIFSLNSGCSTAHFYENNTYIIYNTGSKNSNEYEERNHNINIADFINNIDNYISENNSLTLITNNKEYYLDEKNPIVKNLINSLDNFGKCQITD
ncbi:MAG: hypothetical protein OSJ63_05140 [Bacilli bacterium]|nr:hypothetical protein [Bacilli bacterium]